MTAPAPADRRSVAAVAAVVVGITTVWAYLLWRALDFVADRVGWRAVGVAATGLLLLAVWVVIRDLRARAIHAAEHSGCSHCYPRSPR